MTAEHTRLPSRLHWNDEQGKKEGKKNRKRKREKERRKKRERSDINSFTTLAARGDAYCGGLP